MGVVLSRILDSRRPSPPCSTQGIVSYVPPDSGPGAAFLTSSTAGGGSWLAHATLLSGLWIDNQQRYDEFAASQRLTLTSAFRRANWRTVGVMPGNDGPWQQSESLGYDRIYDAKDMGYRGPAV